MKAVLNSEQPLARVDTGLVTGLSLDRHAVYKGSNLRVRTQYYLYLNQKYWSK